MRTLDELIAEYSDAEQMKIKELADELILETGLSMLREELNLSQRQLAKTLGVSQSAVAQAEQRGNDIRLSTLKRHIEAMGGKLSLTVQMPIGKPRIFNL